MRNCPQILKSAALPFLLLSLGFVLSCVKVKRQYNVQLPALPTAAERSQQAVFELRNSFLASVDGQTVQDLLSQLKTEISEKDFVDTSNSEAKKKPSNVFGGELQTTVGKVTTNVCVKDLSVKTSGQGPMMFALSIQTCGIKVRVQDIKAQLKFKGPLADKPVNVTISEFQLKDSVGIRSFVVNGELGVDSAGTLKLSESLKIEGLESLSDPDSYKFSTIGSDAEGVAAKLKKTREEITTGIIQSILGLGEGYLGSALRDSATRAFKKQATKLNAKALGLNGRSLVGTIGNTTFALSGKLAGIYGDKDITAAIGVQLNELSQKTAENQTCTIETFSRFPDPLASWMRGNPLVIGYSELLATSSFKDKMQTMNGSVMIPFSLMDYLMWKILGTKGACRWPVLLQSGKNDFVTLRYLSPWNFAKFEPVGSTTDNIKKWLVTLTLPDLALVMPASIEEAIQTNLVNNGFIRSTDDISQKLVVRNLSYSVMLETNSADRNQTAKIYVLDENRYLSREGLKAEDIAYDVVSDLQKNSAFAGYDLDKKRTEVINVILSSILNTRLAKHLKNSVLQFNRQDETDAIKLQSVHVIPNGLVVGISAPQSKSQTSLASDQHIDLAISRAKEAAYLQDFDLALYSAPPAGNDAQAIEAIKSLKLPFIVGMSATTAQEAIRGSTDNSNCRLERSMVLPLNEKSSTAVTYSTCVAGSSSTEHRYHVEAPINGPANPDLPVVYMRSLLQSRDLKSIEDASKASPRMDFLAYKTALGEPQGDVALSGGFSASWKYESLRFFVQGICLTAESPCPADKRIVTSFEQWAQ